MFLLPAIYFVVFHYIPMVGNLIAFQKYNIVAGLFNSKWVGFANFKLFLSDPYFWKLLRNTLMLSMLGLVFIFPAPIMLALLLNELRSQLFKRFVQSVAYLPHFLSTVVIAGMVVNFLSYDGIFNQVIHWFGGEHIQFLNDPALFRSIYIGSEVWQQVGWGTIIYLAALTGVDPHLYEAAKMDGANRWKQVVNITIPTIFPVITILFLLNIGHFLSVGYEKILLLYNGSTYETADVIQTYVYRIGLLGGDLSYSSAVGIFQSVVAYFLVIGANRMTRRLGGTSLW
ncbi:sugar ABC transporter permease [Paenibacillus sp. S3N08]|uniref:Sugar ABC transporter permease n=2 Tax=Paenibacillus agricola TaxID=2716264 RepID=A0ABX0JA39_9BACL|nr:sugar ABC transporter permease [Paenibacillus agricola]